MANENLAHILLIKAQKVVYFDCQTWLIEPPEIPKHTMFYTLSLVATLFVYYIFLTLKQHINKLKT